MQNPTIPEREATGQIREMYEALKRAFATPAVPVLFTYIAPYQEYFIFISRQIVQNAADNRFQDLVKETGQSISSVIASSLPPKQEYRQWIQRNANSLDFFHFRADNDYIFRTNVTLAFIFIALRETVKGWAVAAKKINPQTQQHPQKERYVRIYGGAIPYMMRL
jgi:hypothetical protein